ncbi:MAG: hypothetical protein KDA67_09115 [Rhodobacteraceae bacterium]|nr:hypothetical protein [Paracoccaceae bacterium]
MTDRNQKSDREISADLAAFFTAAKKSAAGPSDNLLAAVLKDAERLLPTPGPARPTPARRFSRLIDIWQGLGGWQAATAFGLFLALGIWLGYTPPSGLEPVADQFSGQIETVGVASDYFPLDDMLNEG